MIDNPDERALEVLEKAVYRAQDSLEKTKHFKPFMMLLSDTGELEIIENDIEDSTKSYEDLEEVLVKRMKKNDIDIMALVVDTQIPERLVKEVSTGIRVHLEEKSQRDKKIGARFLYVPYELCTSSECALFVKLHVPIPVGFPAEYII